jgi:septal ring factor EnvC (AmiA/AmiB activator)
MRRLANADGKMLVPLLAVAAVLAMGLAAVAIVLQMQERDKRLAKEQELALVLAERQDLKEQVARMQQAKVQLEDEVARIRKELASAEEELGHAQKAQEELSQSVKERDAQIAKLTADITQARAARDDAKASLDTLASERDALQRQLADLQQAKGQLESKVMELSGQPTVELDKVMVVGGEAAAAPGVVQPASAVSRPGLDGQVVVINREYDFIVMNLGRNHGLAVGQEFQVVRDSQVLARVKVEKVYEELAAAALLPGAQEESIREGDQVKSL